MAGGQSFGPHLRLRASLATRWNKSEIRQLDDFQEEEDRIDREIVRIANGSDPFASAVRTTRMPMIITDPRQDDNPIIFVNNAFLRLTGYERSEVLGRNCRFLQGPGTNREDVDKVRAAIARLDAIEIDLLNYKKDGSTFWNRLLLSPVFHDDDLTYFFASQFDVTRDKQQITHLAGDRESLEAELQTRIADLTASEERLNFALKAGRLGLWTLDLATKRLVASARCKENFGRSAADRFTYQDLQETIDPADFDRWQESVAQALSGSGELDVEYRIKGPDDLPRWIQVRGQTAFDVHDQPISMSGVSIDITERKRGEEHRDLLAREMNHRVKNSLATVQSIFTQTLRSAGSIQAAQKTLASRISALANAQDILISHGWTKSELAHVVEVTLKPFNDGEQIHFGGPVVYVSSATTTALTLAIHELATNATKYGALSHPNGRIAINWQIEDGHVEFVWRETKGPTVSKPTKTGFGSKMIERALAQTVRGEATIDYRPGGIVFRALMNLEAIKPEL